VCMLIQHHYREVRKYIRELDTILGNLPSDPAPGTSTKLDPSQPVAALMVSGYGGLGIHSVLSILRLFPNYYKNILFVSTGVVDSGHFKGRDEVEGLQKQTEENLKRYVGFARGLGLNADYRYTLGTDVLDEAEEICTKIIKEFPRAVFFLGKLIFAKEKMYYRILHNETAYALQRRLQFAGLQTVVLPIRVQTELLM
jgi:hypothetical protein